MIEATLDLEVYDLVAIKKAAYRVADRCTVILGAASEGKLPIEYRFRSGTSESTAAEAIRRFHQELLDEDLRQRLHRETEALRSLLLAHTFSRTGLVER